LKVWSILVLKSFCRSVCGALKAKPPVLRPSPTMKLFGVGESASSPATVGSGVSGMFGLLTTPKVAMQGLLTPGAQTGKRGLPLPSTAGVPAVMLLFVPPRT
jgi:hypothetical protein